MKYVIHMTQKELVEVVHKIVEKIINNQSIIACEDMDDYIARLIQRELDGEEVIHTKDSKKKYGDGNEYEGYDSWIDYWHKHSTNKHLEESQECPCCGNAKKADEIVGGHVETGDGKCKYITPICASCNSRAATDESFRTTAFMVERKYLVPFNYAELNKLRRPK